jgi:hypothetical protein
MPPRECDNDDCDYVTGVDDNGVAFIRWEHVLGCEGPVEYALPRPEDVRKGSFLDFLMNGQK